MAENSGPAFDFTRASQEMTKVFSNSIRSKPFDESCADTTLLRLPRASEISEFPFLGQFYESAGDWIGQAETAIVVDDFVRFLQLCRNVLYTERLFLVWYLRTKRGIESISPECNMNNTTAETIRDIFLDVLLTVRRFLVIENDNSDFVRSLAFVCSKGAQMLTHLQGRMRLVEPMYNSFGKLLVATNKVFAKTASSQGRQSDILALSSLTTGIAPSMSMCFYSMYMEWISLDARIIKQLRKLPAARIPDNYNQEIMQQRFLRKLGCAIPSLRKEDRAFLIDVITGNEGKSCGYTSSYVDQVLRDIGMEKFKFIAFGREKFCANCGRSSYTGSDRLWSCKRCALERVRPKARYCDVQCQKADWLKHKAAVHACSYCGRVPNAGEEQLRACKRCKEENVHCGRPPARYCNGECQRADWPSHKAAVHA